MNAEDYLVFSEFGGREGVYQEINITYSECVFFKWESAYKVLSDIITGKESYIRKRGYIPIQQLIELEETLNLEDFENIKRVEEEYYSFIQQRFNYFLADLNTCLLSQDDEIPNQALFIESIINRIEIDIENLNNEPVEHLDPNNDIDRLYDNCIEILRNSYENLIRQIRHKYKVILYQVGIPEEEVDGENVTLKKNEIVLLLNELGIIQYLKTKYPSANYNDTTLSKIIGAFTSIESDTIRRAIGDLNTGRKNDPYKNDQNLLNVQSILLKLQIKIK